MHLRRLILFALAILPAGADVIDRIAVTVEKDVITMSEIVRQLHITALLNGEQPDASGASRRDAADRLVEQTLIRREMQASGYMPEDGNSGTELYAVFRKRFPNDVAYQQELAKYHLIDADVREAFEWQATFLAFVELRFRPAVTVPQDEMRDWYNEQKRAKNPAVVNATFEEARPQIEQIMTQQRIDNALDRWLGQARTSTRIQYRQEAFR